MYGNTQIIQLRTARHAAYAGDISFSKQYTLAADVGFNISVRLHTTGSSVVVLSSYAAKLFTLHNIATVALNFCCCCMRHQRCSCILESEQ